MIEIVLPSLVVLAYLGTAASLAFKRDWALATVYAAYAVAGAAMVVVTIQRRPI